jgi:hypothetical protein
MKTFRVGLHRLYNITIQADDENKAKELAEYFIGSAKDASTENEKVKYGFNIEEIEMVTNDAFEAEEINNLEFS